MPMGGSAGAVQEIVFSKNSDRGEVRMKKEKGEVGEKKEDRERQKEISSLKSFLTLQVRKRTPGG